jgi:hypothetical protein
VRHPTKLRGSALRDIPQFAHGYSGSTSGTDSFAFRPKEGMDAETSSGARRLTSSSHPGHRTDS